SSSSVDPGETTHCSYAPCRTLWGTYSNNVGGTLTIDTKGTEFNAVLAVYVGTNVHDVTPVAGGCSANHGKTAGEVVTVTYVGGIVYEIVVQPVTCTDVGAVKINYNLAAPALVPSLSSPNTTLTNGSAFTLAANGSGTPPLGYQWRLNGVNLPNQTG